MTYTDKELREEFQNFADSIVWSNDDGSEKYIGVGNMADWWLKKIHQAIAEERERINNKVKDWRRGMSMFGKEVDTFNKAHEQILKVLQDKPLTDKE